MMMLNKDKKFENFNLKSSRGNEDSDEEKVEAHGVHKSWVFRIQTNVENFEKNWKIFSVHLSAENSPENGPRRTIRYQEMSELFWKPLQNCFEFNFKQTSENERPSFSGPSTLKLFQPFTNTFTYFVLYFQFSKDIWYLGFIWTLFSRLLD